MNSLFERECSSGYESGWTIYFEHENSLLSPHQKSANFYITEDHDEEDSSMVSDASSGPPHICDDGNFFIYPPNDVMFPEKNGQRKKNHDLRRKKDQEQVSFLDDTASSPIFNLSTNNLASSNVETSTETMLSFSQGHSSTQFEGKSRFQGHYGCGKSPASGEKLQQYQWNGKKR
ncbi:hypothetical protein DCAR_0933548 [Daucus carota subsp. sativus]|uniref:Uncharacterized protein n=1 Tax=Daucus carota subsp. sativus TaxID=79200 RepID=A0AAF1BEE5_DAUCS|nr:PREDICTED: uncharacterized protein LOC108202140 [Daucus carota subsp. sativus]WOH14032.1 hypothetical protein DCAR_0933548 [Daucus carota subsp. sativus]